MYPGLQLHWQLGTIPVIQPLVVLQNCGSYEKTEVELQNYGLISQYLPENPD